MTRRATEFQTIHSEVGFLPPNILGRVLDPEVMLDGMRPKDQGLPYPKDEMLSRSVLRNPASAGVQDLGGGSAE
jgi:hypothetical protein